MIKAVLIDLSGTLHIDNKAIAGAVDALEKLRLSNVVIRFVTNTTKECSRFLHHRLTKLGFDIVKDEIFSSLAAARTLVQNRKLKPLLLLSPEASTDFEDLMRYRDKPNAVVVGLAPTEFHYERLTEAFRCLLDGAQLIAVHSGRYYKREDGLALGPGFFVKGLEYSAKCTAEVVGKPNPIFFLSALGDIKPEEAIMIGDDVIDDIEGALAVGMQGILVKTGKYREGDEDKVKGNVTVVPSFVEAVEEISKRVREEQ